MAKQVVTTNIEGITTDTYDKLEASITFTIEGRRNVPNLEGMGKACDAATWLFQKLIEAYFIKDTVKNEAAVAAIREQARGLIEV